MEALKPKSLYVVATPLGNLSDMSERAVEILRRVDTVYAEDTRSYQRLATRFQLTARAESYHDHNERSKAARIVERLEQGESAALISDAGTPTISDPGYRLVRACREAGIDVLPVPGPCAAVAALSVSGLPTNRFFFEGFLPPKKGKRGTRLRELLALGVTFIAYESPHRIVSTLEQLAELSPGSEAFLGRELTKLHEETLFGTVASLLASLAARESIKGECVLVVSPDRQWSADADDSPECAAEGGTDDD